MNADGSSLLQLAQGSEQHGEPDWSPRGNGIAFVKRQNFKGVMFILNADGSGLRPLTRTGDNSASTWSPGGKKIVFVSDRSGQPDVYVMDADGSDTRRLTRSKSGQFQEGAPGSTWSPDGRRIAFSNRSFGDLYVVNVNGTGLRQVTRGLNDDYSPAWRPPC